MPGHDQEKIETKKTSAAREEPTVISDGDSPDKSRQTQGLNGNAAKKLRGSQEIGDKNNGKFDSF